VLIYLQNDWEGIESSEVVSGDYSTHPLILGDGFEPRDISVDVINPITQRTSGKILRFFSKSNQDIINPH
jgi:hypothetical protein